VVTPYTVTYDTGAHTAAITSITGVNGETGATVGTVDVSHTSHTTAGNYNADYWTFTGALNYSNIAVTTITDTINKATITVTASGTSQYSDPLNGSSSITGFKGTDNMANSCTGALSLTGVNPGSAPGAYSVGYSGLTCANYTVNSGGSYTVSQEDSTLTYTGLQYFGVPATQTTVNVTLTYTLQDASVVLAPPASYFDANPGDITKAVAAAISITGQYVNSGGTLSTFTGSCNPTPVTAAPGLTLPGSLVGNNPVPSTGTFTCAITLPVNGAFTATAGAGTGSYYVFSGGDTRCQS
jgi:hypothetical protein